MPAAAALAGDELLPVVQAGQTVGASVAQIRTGLLSSSHDGGGGTVHAMALADGAAGFMSGSDKAKLDGVQVSATANSSDTQLRDRATHTGTQPHTSVSGLGTMATQMASSVAISGGTATFSTLTTTGTMTTGGQLTVAANAPYDYAGYLQNTSALGISGFGMRNAAGGVAGGMAYYEAGDLLLLSIATASGAARLQSSGGAFDVMASGALAPAADNQHSIGTSLRRVSQVFAGTGTINTSDEREKEDIRLIDAPLAEALLRAFDPVTFQWRDVDHAAVVETRRAKRQKTTPREVEIAETVRAEDGRFIRVRRTVVERCPAFEAHPVHGEDGAALLGDDGEPVLHFEPVMEEVEEQIVARPAYHKANVRTHWGFVAQQVERGLCGALGLDPDDPAQRDQARLRFAGLVYDQDSDRFGLREGQFISILWASMRDLLDRVEALEAARLPA
ncbi:hypothetical protein N825_34855 [Skermanella stibiiresistens SB22]|uniref:Peptidase S74 domain-containing protein n=1 Tax=Skermanella stibiiresistens SB22 TaxID=1385369 RepID=W9H7C1_9PROT|nr:hypothetical protein N825_34855 [Skermanella stibiiresistens SB22]